MVGGIVEDLSVSWRVGGRWVGRGLVGESVVGGSLAVGSLSLCRWSVSGSLSVVGGFVLSKFSGSMSMFWPQF